MGPVIGGALGGLVLIIIIMVVVILTSRALYKSFFAPVKYTEVYILQPHQCIAFTIIL